MLLRAGAVAALAILLFGTRWFGLATAAHGSFGAATATAVRPWQLLGITRWLVLAAMAATLVSLLRVNGRVAAVATLLGAIATAALIDRLLIDLPDSRAVLDVKLGGYLALIACGALTLGAYEAPAAHPIN